MSPTIPYIIERLAHFNVELFNGKLPPIRVKLSRATTYLGQFSCKKRRAIVGRDKYYDYCLRVSTAYDYEPDVLDDVLIHELIHYYIAYFHYKDTSSHGIVFRQIMNDINARHGRHLTISHKSSTGGTSKTTAPRQRWHVVAVVEFADGHYGIKVLPRVWESIRKYHDGVLRAEGVTGIELWLTNHLLFEQYPVSSAFRVHPTDPALFRPALEGAERLTLPEE